MSDSSYKDIYYTRLQCSSKLNMLFCFFYSLTVFWVHLMQIKAEKFNLNFGQTQIPIHPQACKQHLLCLCNVPYAMSSWESATLDEPPSLLWALTSCHPSCLSESTQWYLRAMKIKAYGQIANTFKAVCWLFERALSGLWCTYVQTFMAAGGHGTLVKLRFRTLSRTVCALTRKSMCVTNPTMNLL